MSPKLATAQLLTVSQPCFSKLGTEDHRSGQSSSVYLYQEGLDEARGQPVLLCLSRRLSDLISKAIPCMIDLKIKQIRKYSMYHERYGISSVCFEDLSQRKKLEVVALTIVSQFGVNFKIMFLVHVPNFGGLSGSEDRGGGDNSIQFINFGRVGDKRFEEWRQKIGGGGWKGG